MVCKRRCGGMTAQEFRVKLVCQRETYKRTLKAPLSSVVAEYPLALLANVMILLQNAVLFGLEHITMTPGTVVLCVCCS